MVNYKLTTPEGTKDYLFDEAVTRSQVTRKLQDLFKNGGYTEVITPGVEYLDVFLAKGHGTPIEEMYKLSDESGKMMALRPDSTTPIARLCATRLRDEPLPLRLYYRQPVYSSPKTLSGKRSEVLQAGIELVGAAGKEADIEALSLAVSALQSVGCSGMRLEIGHIGLFNRLMELVSPNEEIRELLRGLIEDKNYPALNDVLDKLGDNKYILALKQLPRLFGGDEIFAKADALFAGDEILEKVLRSVHDLYTALCEKYPQSDISLDFGIVNRLDYYTGVVFKGYLEGYTGEAALSGGRYDNLMAAFGRDMCAIGFAVNVDAACAALKAQHSPLKQKPLRIALTKGRLEKDTVGLFEKMGFDCQNLHDKGRRLILPIPDQNIEVVLAKAADVITYIENGVCDVGVVGKDTILEYGGSFFEVTDLGFGRCRFALAAKKESDFYSGYAEKTIATKYPNVAREFFRSKGMDVRIVKIEGSVELAPLLSLADAIIDIVETGSTLKENGLEVIEDVVPVSARLIVNTVSMKLYKEQLEALITRIEEML